MNKAKKGVCLKHISKIYQDPKTHQDFYAVRDISLDIAARKLCDVAWSRAGCGKTTTLQDDRRV